MENKTSINQYRFHAADYVVFSVMLVLSAATGIYFALCKKARDSPGTGELTASGKKSTFSGSFLNEYLLGSRKMHIFPVAMSLVASYVSGVTVLGTPAEVYSYGSQYWMIIIPIFFMGFVVSAVFLPVFATLKVGSSYEYLEMRFSSAVRSFASVMFVLDELFFLPIIIYVPSLAFEQATGINLYIISAVICVVCVFYTLVGGIKAVVHTDVWQVIIMFISVLVVIIIGTVKIGGPGEVFKRASDGGRLIFFNISPSLYDRHTFWGIAIGGFFYWTSFNSVNQTMVQRYMSLPSKKRGQQSMIIYTIGMMIFVSVCCYAGLLIYSFYYKCDPLSSKVISTGDQLFPLYVMQTVGHLPGLPGLFIVGVFGAALSSLSVVLNSTALVILEDIIKGCFRLKLNERQSKFIVKGSIAILGCLAFALVAVIRQLGGVLSLATSLSAIAAGTTFGVFVLGMLIPWSNSKGAITGGIAGALMSGWVSFGINAVSGKISSTILPMSTSECPVNMTSTSTYFESIDSESQIFPLYRLAYHWVNPIGLFTVVIVGTIVSFATGASKINKLDADLISPVLHRFLPKECFSPQIDNRKGMTKDDTATTLMADR